MRAFLKINVCGHAAVVAPILRLRLTAEIQKLKHNLKFLKCKSLKHKSN